MSQVAVVIGGGQTLGEFLCRGLAAEGYRVAVVDIQSEKAARVADTINTEFGEGMAYGFGADATSEQSVMALARGVDEIFGRTDLLVYSAGIAKAAFISDVELGDFDRSLQVNLVGYFLCAREFSRLMIRDGIQGRIIQINSKSGKVGSKHNSGYSAAKFGGVGLTQSLALDLAEYGITVHSLMLGNLFKECGVTDRLSDTAQNAMMNIVTIFLGLCVGAKATGTTFLSVQTIYVIILGLFAFAFSTVGGLLLGKLMCVLSKGKINPLIGSAGVSAVPMAARVSQIVGQKENPSNFLLMHAMGPNVAGVIGSAVAAGFLLAVFGPMVGV